MLNRRKVIQGIVAILTDLVWPKKKEEELFAIDLTDHASTFCNEDGYTYTSKTLGAGTPLRFPPGKWEAIEATLKKVE